MDLDLLNRRKAELEQARINVTNSWQVITGHIQECDHMISLMSAPAEPVEPVANEDEVPVV